MKTLSGSVRILIYICATLMVGSVGYVLTRSTEPSSSVLTSVSPTPLESDAQQPAHSLQLSISDDPQLIEDEVTQSQVADLYNEVKELESLEAQINK